MSRIKKTGESIKRKLAQKEKPLTYPDIMIDPRSMRGKPDFTLTKEESMEGLNRDSNTVRQNTSKPASQQAGKRKVTFYIPLEIEGKLNEVYARKMMKNEKEDKSSLISRAIDLLWKEEKNYDL